MRIYSLFLTLLFVVVSHFSFSQEITEEQQEIMNKTVYSINNYQKKDVDSIYHLYISVYPNAFDRQVESIDTTDISDWKNLESIFMRARSRAKPKLVHQFFEKLEPQFEELLNIKSISFFNLNLDKIPLSIFKIKTLEYFSVQMNPIFSSKNLFSNLDSLPNLSRLFLYDCRLDYIPENIGNLIKLKELDLSANRLKELPASMRFLTELEELHISQNDFIEFPYVVLEFKKLRKLSLNFNNLTDEEKEIPFPAFNGNKEGYEKEVEEYDEKLKKMRENEPEKMLPKQIKKLSLLNELSVTASHLRNLPQEMKELILLEKLDLGWNLFSDETNLFDILKEMKKLKTLNLEGNKFIVLPNEIGSLTFLKTINLNQNKLTNLPESIKKLQNLENLYLFENNFSEEEREKIRSWLPNTKIHFDYF